jgi:hypothetical protein
MMAAAEGPGEKSFGLSFYIPFSISFFFLRKQSLVCCCAGEKRSKTTSSIGCCKEFGLVVAFVSLLLFYSRRRMYVI